MSILKNFLKKGKIGFVRDLIKDGRIEIEDIDTLYSILSGDIDLTSQYENRLIFYTWLFLRKNKNFIDFSQLQKILNIPAKALKNIFVAEPIKVKFPTASEEKERLVTAYIFPLKEKTDILSFSKDREINEALKIIQRAVNKNFFVIFDDEFTGKSFMLSVAAGLLLPEDILERYAFTGVLDESGEVYPVEHLDNKERAAKAEGLVLISPESIDNLQELVYWLGNKSLDIPFVFVVGKPKDEAFKSLKKLEQKIKEKVTFYSIEKLKEFFSLEEDDLIAYTEKYLPVLKNEELERENEWSKQIKKYEEKLKNIYSKVEGKNRIIHFGFSIPASLAMASGIKLGAKRPVVLYHYQADEYHQVIDLSDETKIRAIKEIEKNPENFKYISVYPLKENSSEEVALSIWIASHNPHGDVLKFSEDKNWSVFAIENKAYPGNLPLNEEVWKGIAKEVYSAINILKNKSASFHIFLSSPVPEAFAIGMALGHFAKGVIYNFNSQNHSYYPVAKIENLVSIF